MNNSANPGLRAFFGTLVLLTRLSGGKVRGGGEKVDLTGFTGSINMEFTGAGGSTWHCVVAKNYVRFFPGAEANARATVTLSVEDFFKMLAGKTSPYTAGLTGRVRVKGEGHAGMMVGGIVTQVDTLRKTKGLAGVLARWWTDRVLRKSGTGHTFPSGG
ncbi:MAG: SCP2 sterol-binding domain-containing protein [Nitrospirae bacterium]|nr:SCP2 sterol-binding domain-containing protein [Nitrospirota bacterium]